FSCAASTHLFHSLGLFRDSIVWFGWPRPASPFFFFFYYLYLFLEGFYVVTLGAGPKESLSFCNE
ncbi:MAG: hypothetical protein AB9888_13155, partial [Bacteroidales bacterium]